MRYKMNTSIIRNAGFERGTMEFWRSYNDAVLTAHSTDQKYGSYSGKAAYGSTATDGIVSADYLPVQEGEIYRISAYMRSSTSRYGGIKAICYDSDYSLITEHSISWGSIDNSWNEIEGVLHVPFGVEYVRIACLSATMSAGLSVLVDSVSMIPIDESFMTPIGIPIQAMTAVTTSFNTAADKKTFYGMPDYYLDMQYSYVGGTATSITVNVMEINPVNGQGYIVGTYTIPVVATSINKRIDCDLAVGHQMYVDCVIVSPSSLDAYMALSIVGRRR